MGPPLLTTPRLVLSPAGRDDAEAIVAFHTENAAFLGPWSPPRPEGFLTVAYWQRQADLIAAEAATGTALRFLLRHGDGLAGMANFTQIFRGPFCAATLGYGLGRRFEGQGLMHEALAALLPYMFDVVGLHRIQANHLPQNLRSARLLRRLGFVVEGYARDYVFIDGAWRDHVLTSLTNPRPTAPPA